jgi:alpha-glucosidase
MRRSLFFSILAFSNLFICQARTQKFEISSPDKLIGVTVEIGKSISYSVKYKEKNLILPSGINISFQPDHLWGKDKVVIGVSSKVIDGIITPIIKEKRAVIPNIYSELTIHFKNFISLQFRVYNDGVAYHFSTNLPGDITILSEEAGFNFQPGTTIYYPQVNKRTDADIFHTSFEENYSKAQLDTLSNRMFTFSPVLLKAVNLPAVLITESDVNDYPGMFLEKAYISGLKGRFASYPLKETESTGGFRQKLVVERAPYIARTRGTRTFPWRIIAIAPSDADLLVNDIVYRLAPDPGFTDFGWIKPGKSTEEWITGLNLNKVDFIAGLNTQTYKYYIDFAVRFGFQYVMLDAGWSDVNDLFNITPGMDMDEISGYAAKKGIGLILWTQALTIEKQMEQALKQFKKWDIKIVMTDFIDRNDQVAINFLHRFAGECARNKLMCMIHGAPIPAGFSRTWPNMLAREGVLGSEYNAWSSKANPEHDLMLPFIRMVAGPMDYEPGLLQNATKDQTVKMGFEKVIAQGTTTHQIAMFEIYESPLQLFSGNLSDAVREPELMEFLGSIPTVWDETVILEASIGKYILEARRNGDNWYVAAINDWNPKEFRVSMSFLKEGSYQAETVSDGINAARNPQDYSLQTRALTPKDTITIKLAPGGGFLARILKK